MRLTRWQSFYYYHPSPLQQTTPLQKVWYLTVFVSVWCLYGYAFFHWQPDRSHETIETWNTALQEKARIEGADRRAKRIRAQELAAQEKMRRENKKANDNDNDDDDNNEDDAPQQQQRDDNRFLWMLLVWYGLWLAKRGYDGNSNSRHYNRRRRLFRRSLFRPLQPPQRWWLSQQQQQHRRERFQQWADRLNEQRQVNGQAPISLASLELVMRERDMTGEDYDNLLQFDQEAGPALEALLNGGMGASLDEINRCPLRTLESGDDDEEELLRSNRSANGVNTRPHCAICLEQYHSGDQVRTIPCFHSFHKDCVDPWLAQRAVCPVCKHSAIG